MGKKVKIVMKGTFEEQIEGDKSLVTKKYVDQAHPQEERLSYNETLAILEGRGS